MLIQEFTEDGLMELLPGRHLCQDLDLWIQSLQFFLEGSARCLIHSVGA